MATYTDNDILQAVKTVVLSIGRSERGDDPVAHLAKVFEALDRGERVPGASYFAESRVGYGPSATMDPSHSTYFFRIFVKCSRIQGLSPLDPALNNGRSFANKHHLLTSPQVSTGLRNLLDIYGDSVDVRLTATIDPTQTARKYPQFVLDNVREYVMFTVKITKKKA